MRKYAVWVACPIADKHWQALCEVARGVAYSLQEISGCITPCEYSSISSSDASQRLIAFNVHTLTIDVSLPSDTIIYNTEQVAADAEQYPMWRAYLALLRRHQVWDYSEENIRRLKRLGVERAVLCPVGYYPGLQNVVPVEKQDVDVLFVGSMNDRRARILNALQQRRIDGHTGKRTAVKHLFGIYDDERNQWIARSKVVLNMHHYDTPIFEIFRTSHLWANRKCVVTENGGCDETLETLAMATCEHVPYDKLADACVALVRNAGRRRELAENGFRVFSQIDQKEMVQRALEASV